MIGMASVIAMSLIGSPTSMQSCDGAPNHPMFDILIEQPPTPDIFCPTGQSALQCIIDRRNNFIQDMSDLNEYWKDIYCQCKCCPEIGGYDNSQDCIDHNADWLQPYFINVWAEYVQWTPPAGCCVVPW